MPRQQIVGLARRVVVGVDRVVHDRRPQRVGVGRAIGTPAVLGRPSLTGPRRTGLDRRASRDRVPDDRVPDDRVPDHSVGDPCLCLADDLTLDFRSRVDVGVERGQRLDPQRSQHGVDRSDLDGLGLIAQPHRSGRSQSRRVGAFATGQAVRCIVDVGCDLDPRTPLASVTAANRQGLGALDPIQDDHLGRTLEFDHHRGGHGRHRHTGIDRLRRGGNRNHVVMPDFERSVDLGGGRFGNHGRDLGGRRRRCRHNTDHGQGETGEREVHGRRANGCGHTTRDPRPARFGSGIGLPHPGCFHPVPVPTSHAGRLSTRPHTPAGSLPDLTRRQALYPTSHAGRLSTRPHTPAGSLPDLTRRQAL